MTKPITPAEAKKIYKNVTIPEFVFRAFNDLIIEKFDGKEAKILSKDVIKLIQKYYKEEQDGALSHQTILNNHWLDIENHYQKNGWCVMHDQPGYGDSNFDAYFKFSVKT